MAQVKISQFSGIKPNGYFWLDGLLPRTVGNKSFLESAGTIEKVSQRGDAGLTDLAIIIGFDSRNLGTGNEIPYVYGIDNGGNIYRGLFGSGYKEFRNPTPTASQYGDLKFFTINGLEYGLYTTQQWVGKFYEIGTGTVSASTQFDITNTTGTTYRYTYDGTGTNPNISSTNPAIGDVAVISGQYFNAGNNGTFTITGSGTNYFEITNASGVAENDKTIGTGFIRFFDDDWKNLGSEQPNWSRQMVVGDDTIFIGNGTYVASIYKDGVLTASDQLLPAGYLYHSSSYNNSRLLIGANGNDKGMILLWDTASENYDNIKKFKSRINGITSYGNGWLVCIGSDIYFTDGFNFQKTSTFPDCDNMSRSFTNVGLNGMMTLGDNLLINGGVGALGKWLVGLWVLNIKNAEWSFIPYDIDGTRKSYYGNIPGAIFHQPGGYILLGYDVNSWISNPSFIGGLSLTSYSSLAEKEFISPYIVFNKKAKINYIILEVLANHQGGQNEVSNNAYIKATLKIANTIRPIYSFANTNGVSANASTIKVDGTVATYNKAEVGDEVMVMEGTNSGYRRNIISIANLDLANEIWTLDSAMNGNTEEGIHIQVMPFRKIGTTQTITNYSNNRFYFDCAGTEASGACLLKFLFTNSYSPFLISAIIVDYDLLQNLK